MSSNTIVVVQYRSAIRGTKKQNAILKGLGLGKLNRKKILRDTPDIRGMVNKIPHLVKIV